MAKRYTDEELLTLLKEYTKNGNTRQDFFKQKQAINLRFGSWNKALKLIGVEPKKIRRYSKEQMKEKLLKEYNKNNKIPSCEECTFRNTVYKLFGTWNNALKYAGLEYRKISEKITYTREELKEIYINFSLENNFENGASSKELQKGYKEGKLLVKYHVFSNYFSGMNGLRKECGFEIINRVSNYTKEELTLIMKNKIKELRRNPSLREFNRMRDMPSVTTYYKFFKTHSFLQILEEIERSGNGK